MALDLRLLCSELPPAAGLCSVGGLTLAGAVAAWRSCPAALRAARAFRRLLPCPVLLIGLQHRQLSQVRQGEGCDGGASGLVCPALLS